MLPAPVESNLERREESKAVEAEDHINKKGLAAATPWQTAEQASIYWAFYTRPIL